MSPARKKSLHASPGYWVAFALSIVIPLARTAHDVLDRLARLETRLSSLQEQNDVQNARLSALERGGH